MKPSKSNDTDADPEEQIKPEDYFPLELFTILVCLVMGLIISDSFSEKRARAEKRLWAVIEDEMMGRPKL